jgi:small neutral amino acid transporter SnatA (MarC family)
MFRFFQIRRTRLAVGGGVFLAVVAIGAAAIAFWTSWF